MSSRWLSIRTLLLEAIVTSFGLPFRKVYATYVQNFKDQGCKLEKNSCVSYLLSLVHLNARRNSEYESEYSTGSLCFCLCLVKFSGDTKRQWWVAGAGSVWVKSRPSLSLGERTWTNCITFQAWFFASWNGSETYKGSVARDEPPGRLVVRITGVQIHTEHAGQRGHIVWARNLLAVVQSHTCHLWILSLLMVSLAQTQNRI